MPVPTVSYITPADLKTQTLIAGLKNLQDEELTALIQTAEDMIDAYVGRQKHHWRDTNTDRVFPRDIDQDKSGNPAIPYRVSRATLRQVEWLYTQWWSASATDELPLQHDVKSEDIGGDGSIQQTYARDGMDVSQATVAPQARALLGGFRSKFAGIDVSDPVSNEPVRAASMTDQVPPTGYYPR